MLPRARRPRADQPNSAHWESHKETLRHLYLEDNHPLKTVREIMQQHHDFNATDKMYKYHFKRWKFRKNMTQREAQRHEADAVAGRGVVLPLAYGRELGSQRLKMRIMKLSSPMKFNGPDVFSPIQLALRSVLDHSQEHLKSWDLPKYQSGMTATESWAHDACLAGYAISANQEAGANYKVLSKAAIDFNTILGKDEPAILWSIFAIIIQLFQVKTKLALEFIRVVWYCCKAQLPDGDPLKTLWENILNTDPSQIPQLIAQLAAAQLDFFREELGPTNPFVVKYIKTSAKYLHDRNLLSSAAAHAQIDSIISALRVKLRISGSSTSASIKNSLISAYLFKACIHLDNKQYYDVEIILGQMEPEVEADHDIDPAQRVNFYEIKAEMLMERGDSEREDYFHSEGYYKKALETAQQNLSESMPGRIGYCYAALRKFYESIGNLEAAEEVRSRYNQHLNQMAGDMADNLPIGELHIDEPLLNPMNHVSDVLSHFGPGQHTIELHVQWELPEFVSQGLDSLQDLPTVMTITGQQNEACISSCKNYIESTWSRNTLIIGFFRGLIDSNLDFSVVTHDQTIFSSTELNVSASISPPEFVEDSPEITFRVQGENHHLVEICQCILWLTATCRPPESGSIHQSVAKFRRLDKYTFQIDTKPLEPLPPPGSQSDFTCCWLNMFDGGYILAQGFPTPPRKHGRGLELPFDIMIEQAMTYTAINHTVNGEDCLILKGRYTALVPVCIEGIETLDQTSEVQWHLVGKRPDLVPINKTEQDTSDEDYHLTDVEFTRTDRELSWEDIDQVNEGGLRIFPIRGIKELYSKRSFVGHFPKAQILVGTDKEIYDELKGGPTAETVRGNVIKFGQALNLTFGTNLATAGLLTMSASTAIKRSRFDSVPKQFKALITDKLRNDRNKPHILYDISKKVAWMIPEACLILYLIHYWAFLQSDISPLDDQTDPQQPPRPGQDDPEAQTMSSVKEHMPFIEASSNAAQDAANAIVREFKRRRKLPEHIRFIEEPEKLVYVSDIIGKMYMAIEALVEHQQRKRPGVLSRLNPLSADHLWGYNLADVAGFDEAAVKRVPINKEQCGGWYELTNPNYKIVVLFGNNLGELIKYEADQIICQQWKSVPAERDFLSADSGTLEYLQKLDTKGRCGIFLTGKDLPLPDFGQKQCQDEGWPCCDMTLQLTLTAPKMMIKVEKGEAVVIGKVSRKVSRKGLAAMVRKRSVNSNDTSLEGVRKLRKQDHSQCESGLPGACSLCTEANRLEIGSSSEKSSPEGAEIDLGSASVASSSNTPQTGWV